MFPNPNTPQLTKLVQPVGDGKDKAFVLWHPQAPFVTVTVYSTKDHREVRPDILHSEGRITLNFAEIPEKFEFTVVVIG